MYVSVLFHSVTFDDTIKLDVPTGDSGGYYSSDDITVVVVVVVVVVVMDYHVHDHGDATPLSR